ncbi:hypothetical protein LV78_001715 [Actinosynnema pretiosum]|nr:hypothetical protein [Actinosynnema pretiosum]
MSEGPEPVRSAGREPRDRAAGPPPSRPPRPRGGCLGGHVKPSRVCRATACPVAPELPSPAPNPPAPPPAVMASPGRGLQRPRGRSRRAGGRQRCASAGSASGRSRVPRKTTATAGRCAPSHGTCSPGVPPGRARAGLTRTAQNPPVSPAVLRRARRRSGGRCGVAPGRSTSAGVPDVAHPPRVPVARAVGGVQPVRRRAPGREASRRCCGRPGATGGRGRTTNPARLRARRSRPGVWATPPRQRARAMSVSKIGLPVVPAARPLHGCDCVSDGSRRNRRPTSRRRDHRFVDRCRNRRTTRVARHQSRCCESCTSAPSPPSSAWPSLGRAPWLDPLAQGRGRPGERRPHSSRQLVPGNYRTVSMGLSATR